MNSTIQRIITEAPQTGQLKTTWAERTYHITRFPATEVAGYTKQDRPFAVCDLSDSPQSVLQSHQGENGSSRHLLFSVRRSEGGDESQTLWVFGLGFAAVRGMD